MHEPERRAVRRAPAVRVVEAVGRRRDDRDRRLVGQRDLAALRLQQHLAQVAAVHELHREEVHAAVDRDIEHRGDVLVLEQADQPRLIEEQRARLGLGRALRRQHLDRDVLREARRGPSCAPR